MKAKTTQAQGRIRVGIGGWSYAPWRETFYPPALPKAQELHYASRVCSAIEINSTFYGPQKPATYAKWYAQTPDDFVFAVKAPRSATHRRDLAESGAAIARFIENGPGELCEKLGPILWQFAPTKTFVAAEFEQFLGLLPRQLGRLPLRHALNVRHASFSEAACLRLARKYQAALVYTDAAGLPVFADASADFVYLRLREAQAQLKTGYTPAALRRWAEAARGWSAGGIPSGMRAGIEPAPAVPRDTFVFFINGAKERAPAAAQYLLELLKTSA